MLDESEMDPDEIAELSPHVPEMKITYRPSDAALLCTVFGTETKITRLPDNNDKDACVRAIFGAASDIQKSNCIGADRISILQIDCQGLRLCLVARSTSCITNLEVSFSVVPVSQISPFDTEHALLIEEAKDVAQMYVPVSRNQEQVIGRSGKRLFVPQGTTNRTTGGVSSHRDLAKKMERFTTQCSPPTRSYRLCEPFGVTIGLFRCTTFEVDGKGGFFIQRKSRLREDRPGAVVEARFEMGIYPRAFLAVQKRLEGETFQKFDGAKYWKFVLYKMHYSRQLRRWFLSALLTGTVSVHAESQADAFLPSSITREVGKGLRLDDPMPAWFFDVVGGTVFSVSKTVYFRVSSEMTTARKVRRIDNGGLMRISNEEICCLYPMPSRISYWDLRGLSIGKNL